MLAGRSQQTIHRALADERRTRIVDELRESPRGLDAHELARRLALHPNTIRWHLGILSDAGIVTSDTEGRTTPGRPRIVYTIAGGADVGEPEHYRLLSTILTGVIGSLEDGISRAREAGLGWGRYLVKRPPPYARTSREQATTEIVELLDEHGFRPEAVGGQIHMHRCPFRELAQTAPRVVCGVHEGLISGALAELQSDLEVETLEAFVEPGLCIARLRPKSTSESSPDG